MMEILEHSPQGFCWSPPVTRIAKPLHGYTFYIDVQDEEEEDVVETLEGKITNLGGTIRKLLSKGILYFISGTGSKKSKLTRRSGRFLKQNETRAKIPKARNISYPCSALERARTMGLRIFTLTKVMNWVKEIERRRIFFSPTKVQAKYGLNGGCGVNQFRHVSNIQNTIPQQCSPPSIPSLTDFKTDSKNFDEELIPPFLKVEDKKHKYEPQYLEFDMSFPILDLNSKLLRCPFRKARLNSTMDLLNTTCNTTHHELASGDVTHNDDDDDDDGMEDEEKTLSSTSNYSRSGWCDFCESFFRIRDRHIKSKKHRLNRPLETFRALDELITSCGTLDDFVNRADEIRKEREKQEKKDIRVFFKTLEGAKLFRNARVELNDVIADRNGKLKKETGIGFKNAGLTNVVR